MARRLPPQMLASATAAYSGMQALVTVAAALIIGFGIRDYGYRTILVSLAVWAAVPAALWLATSRTDRGE
jgi:hypothetical protein